jgi:hypothetical protein
MSRARLEAIVREFAQNGLKLLLEHPRNVQELLAVTSHDVVGLIDLERMRRVPTTFVQRDYRHLEADVVLHAPLRRQRGRRGVMVYILIEHQSEPDPLMAFRVLEYVVQIYKAQVRQWERRHGFGGRVPRLGAAARAAPARAAGGVSDLAPEGDRSSGNHAGGRAPALVGVAFLRARLGLS